MVFSFLSKSLTFVYVNSSMLIFFQIHVNSKCFLVSSKVTIKYISQFKQVKSCYTRETSLSEDKVCVLIKMGNFCQSESQN